MQLHASAQQKIVSLQLFTHDNLSNLSIHQKAVGGKSSSIPDPGRQETTSSKRPIRSKTFGSTAKGNSLCFVFFFCLLCDLFGPGTKQGRLGRQKHPFRLSTSTSIIVFFFLFLRQKGRRGRNYTRRPPLSSACFCSFQRWASPPRTV